MTVKSENQIYNSESETDDAADSEADTNIPDNDDCIVSQTENQLRV